MNLYQPSNGTEGECFIDKWCANCIHEDWLHTQKDGDKKCDILSNTMIYNLSDPEYPTEWIEEDGVPRCTAFKKRVEYLCDTSAPPIERDPNTLELFLQP